MANLGYVEGRGSQESHTAALVLRKSLPWLKERWPAVLAVLIVIAAWEMFAALGWIKVLFFPPPSQILSATADLLVSGNLLKHMSATLLRLVQGLILGAIPG